MTPHEQTILHHLQRIEKKLDTLNDHVAEHGRWIAAQKVLCAAHSKSLDKIKNQMSKHQTYIDTRRGSRSGIGATVQHVLMILTLLTAIAAIVWRS